MTMLCRSVVLALLLPLVACSSTQTVPEPDSGSAAAAEEPGSRSHAAMAVESGSPPSTGVEPESVSLEGTTWQLVGIQSMDDRVFTPDERAKYTLTFESGGKLLVRADCNRGQGSWTREGSSGLQFGPLATTRAACPPDSLHDRFLSDLSYVRSFVADGGHIFLATMADGAILEFEPLPSETAEPAAD